MLQGFEHTKFKKRKRIKDFISSAIIILVGLFFALCVKTAVVSGNSMSPTYMDNDFVIIIKYLPIHNGDVVGIYSEELHEDLCKRVIAQQGDTIEGTVQGFCVNGEVIDEPYLQYNDFVYIFEEQTVPENTVYVLGDNRDNSTDSRELGFLSADDITGRIVLNCTKVFGLTYGNFKKALMPLWFILFLSILLSAISENRKHTL